MFNIMPRKYKKKLLNENTIEEQIEENLKPIYLINKFKKEQATKINKITQDFLNNNFISF
jgi:hypothetical protein